MNFPFNIETINKVLDRDEFACAMVKYANFVEADVHGKYHCCTEQFIVGKLYIFLVSQPASNEIIVSSYFSYFRADRLHVCGDIPGGPSRRWQVMNLYFIVAVNQ